MRVALITGASRGLGLALTGALVGRGWEVIVDARDGTALHRAIDDVAGPGRVLALPGDVTDPDHRTALLGAVTAAGRLDLLVNNASSLGPSPMPRLDDLALSDLRRVLEINLVAPLALLQALLPQLRASRGTVIDLSSDAGLEAYPRWGAYGTSKAALDHLTAILAEEQPGVAIYAFDPGDMRTRMHQDAFPGEDISDRPAPATVVPALLRLLAERPPSGRYRASELTRRDRADVA